MAKLGAAALRGLLIGGAFGVLGGLFEAFRRVLGDTLRTESITAYVVARVPQDRYQEITADSTKIQRIADIHDDLIKGSPDLEDLVDDSRGLLGDDIVNALVNEGDRLTQAIRREAFESVTDVFSGVSTGAYSPIGFVPAKRAIEAEERVWVRGERVGSEC